MKQLRVVIVKPSKYLRSGYVERFARGFMPNSTLYFIKSMTPPTLDGVKIEVHTIDEYIHTDVRYLDLFDAPAGTATLVALVGVQSHQFQRALDLAAFARHKGCLAIIGGPHPMTCDTTLLQGHGVSFAMAEAELIWLSILRDAMEGELQAVYGEDMRWMPELTSHVIIPPSKDELRRYVVPMLGIYPARGCPYTCNFCSVIKIAGRKIRSHSIDTILASLRAAKAAGITHIMFTSDNFNKYPDAEELLEAMVEEDLDLEIFVQCDTQIEKQEDLVALLARAGCNRIFIGVESFKRENLVGVSKYHNRPEHYKRIVDLCKRYKVGSHFSNIIGFPNDDATDVYHHLETLNEMAPDRSSFYILFPIPGTQQYDEFQAENLIYEQNLDRFDASCLTFRHPHFSAKELDDLLFHCYKSFYSSKALYRSLKRQGRPNFTKTLHYTGIFGFYRYAALKKMPPMAGGVWRAKVDHVRDFLPLRKSTYNVERVPLPKSLRTPDSHEALLKD